MMEKDFNEQESLRLITRMIAQAKERFQKRNGDSIILWGYSIMILALANFGLLHVLDEGKQALSYCVWGCTLPLFIVNYVNEARKAGNASVRNYIDYITGHLWLGFFVSNLILVASAFVLAWAFRAYHGGIVFGLITPMIMGMTGLCLFINGKLYRFRPFVYGAAVFWAGALLSVAVLAVWQKQSLQFLALALCMIPGFILPGHILNRKDRQDV
jgi:hypothetical protein